MRRLRWEPCTVRKKMRGQKRRFRIEENEGREHFWPLFRWRMERKTDRPKQWKCQRFNEGHYGCKNKAFVKKKDIWWPFKVPQGILFTKKMHKVSNGAFISHFVRQFWQGTKQGGCETVSEWVANTRMREIKLTFDRWMWPLVIGLFSDKKFLYSRVPWPCQNCTSGIELKCKTQARVWSYDVIWFIFFPKRFKESNLKLQEPLMGLSPLFRTAHRTLPAAFNCTLIRDLKGTTVKEQDSCFWLRRKCSRFKFGLLAFFVIHPSSTQSCQNSPCVCVCMSSSWQNDITKLLRQVVSYHALSLFPHWLLLL